MKRILSIGVVLGSLVLAEVGAQSIDLPYLQLRWSEEEAAAHLLNRLAYGPRHGQVKQLSQKGQIEEWVSSQIYTTYDDDSLENYLKAKYEAIGLDMQTIAKTYPAPGVRLIFMAFQRGVQSRNTGGITGGRGGANMDNRMMNSDSTGGNGQVALLNRILNAEQNTNERYLRFQQFGEERFGWKSFEDLCYQAMAQKVERSIYNENQLEEIMVDFWFNHFNVSLHGANDMAVHVLSYERDAIRPYALGKFRDLLGATARHPAMLHFLDNHRSNADEDRRTLAMPNRQRVARYEQLIANNEQFRQFAQQPGVNENYARELLELHTLGVDGGYTQKDVEEIARAFTGWKASPLLYPIPSQMEGMVKGRIQGTSQAILQEGFYFDPTRHDAEEKVILEKGFPAGGGIEEGERILDIVASHPSTASFISYKIAQRFVADEPPMSLVEGMSNVFQETDGDIRSVLTAMISSEEFWDRKYQHGKIKTPFEVIISSLRALDVEIEDSRSIIKWSTQMGQPLYAYQAPTGYPEEATHWTNGAAMINRMNFGLSLSKSYINGVEVNLPALNQGREPESPARALSVYADILLPGRDTEETCRLLLPVLSDSSFAEKVAERSDIEMSSDTEEMAVEPGLAQVVGLILGSPEFQRQ